MLDCFLEILLSGYLDDGECGIYLLLYLAGFELQQSLFHSTVYEYIKHSKKKKSGTSALFSELEI